VPIRYVYTGNPMNGSEEDEFFIVYAGSTGTSNNAIYPCLTYTVGAAGTLAASAFQLGAAAAVRFANLDGAPAIFNTDFLIVA
jgi:hypothetical protein